MWCEEEKNSLLISQTFISFKQPKRKKNILDPIQNLSKFFTRLAPILNLRWAYEDDSSCQRNLLLSQSQSKVVAVGTFHGFNKSLWIENGVTSYISDDSFNDFSCQLIHLRLWMNFRFACKYMQTKFEGKFFFWTLSSRLTSNWKVFLSSLILLRFSQPPKVRVTSSAVFACCFVYDKLFCRIWKISSCSWAWKWVFYFFQFSNFLLYGKSFSNFFSCDLSRLCCDSRYLLVAVEMRMKDKLNLNVEFMTFLHHEETEGNVGHGKVLEKSTKSWWRDGVRWNEINRRTHRKSFWNILNVDWYTNKH